MRKGTRFTSILAGLGMVAGLLAPRPARGVNTDAPLPIVEKQEGFDYFEPLTISLSNYNFNGLFGWDFSANAELESSLVLELVPIKKTKYGLPVLGGFREVLMGRFSLGPETQLTAQFRFIGKSKEQPTMEEMLRARLGIMPEKFFDMYGHMQRSLDELVFELKQGDNYFELKEGRNSKSFRANFKGNIAFGFSEKDSKKSLEAMIGNLKLAKQSTSGSHNYILDYKFDGCTIHLMKGNNARQFMISAGDSLLNYSYMNGNRNITLRHGPYSAFINPDKKVYLFAPEGWNIKVTDAAYGVDVDLKRGRWRLEHLDGRDRDLIQYFLNKNFALGLIGDENGIRPYNIVWRKDLRGLRLKGFNLGNASIELGFSDSYTPNIGLNIGSPGSPFFLKYNSTKKSLTLNWNDPDNEHNGLYLDTNGNKTVGWATYQIEF